MARRSGAVAAASAVAGSHVCWSFEGRQEFCRSARGFLQEGAQRGERLLYVADRESPGDLRADLAGMRVDVDRLVDDGSLVLGSSRDLYEEDGAFDASRQVSFYEAFTAASLASGYTGMRVAADATPLVATPEARRAFAAYEHAVDRFIATAPMSALCGYDVGVLGAAVRELSVVHPEHRVADAVTPGFSLYHDGDGLVLEGEIDVSNHDLLDLALEVALASGGDDVVVDLGRLAFADVGGMCRLDAAVRGASTGSRTVRVVNVPPLVQRCSALVGLALHEPEPARTGSS